jgi:enamine deaminase RidA (YjgF/YER057c/UK114 family)
MGAVLVLERAYRIDDANQSIRSNGFLFVSGQVGSTEDGSPEPDLEAQVDSRSTI